MSKERGKSTTRKGNPNRARSKNNPNGKRNDPKTDWRVQQGLRLRGKELLGGLVAIADKVRDILGIAPGIRDKRASAILVFIVKSEDLSYWGLVKHYQKHPGDPKRCKLYGPCIVICREIQYFWDEMTQV